MVIAFCPSSGFPYPQPVPVFSWARARPEAMSNAIATKIMIACPVINSLLEKLLGQKSLNLN
jgi:hypothetical protein